MCLHTFSVAATEFGGWKVNQVRLFFSFGEVGVLECVTCFCYTSDNSG